MPDTRAYTEQELRLLQLLSRRYPTVTAAHIEMINLSAILALPKGTDHYISDIHGAYAQFDHMLRHASGAIRRKIGQTFGTELTPTQQTELALLVYYPQLTLERVLPAQPEPDSWMELAIGRLARLARTSAQKYTRSKVRKRLDPQLAYILEELLSESADDIAQKEQYYHQIVRSVLELGEGRRLIITLADVIQRLVVDRLNILGDIYDRGPSAELVMDRLIAHDAVTIQWGNHDVCWMAAASGAEALIANVVRIALRYASLETLEDGYDISLRPLARLAEQTYADDPAGPFQPKAGPPVENYLPDLLARMHKAITIIQFKLEAQIIRRHPEYVMQDRQLLDALDLERGTIRLDGRDYPLLDAHFPTLDRTPGADRSQLTDGEQAAMAALRAQFTTSPRLQRHIRFLYSYGNMYEVQDGNLKFHGCLPVSPEGALISFPLAGEPLAGPALLERYEQLARAAFFGQDPADRQQGHDALWYLWCGQQSPLYGRSRMTTFERYFIADPATHEEPKGPYYALREQPEFCEQILAAFGADPERGHIINGHTPVKVRKGERPVFAGGRLIVIDGGISEAYQPVTGIAGYTLIGNSHELLLAAHEPFASAEAMIARAEDPAPQTELVDRFPKRVLIADTDTGRALRGQLADLARLVEAYRQGVLVERGE